MNIYKAFINRKQDFDDRCIKKSIHKQLTYIEDFKSINIKINKNTLTYILDLLTSINEPINRISTINHNDYNSVNAKFFTIGYKQIMIQVAHPSHFRNTYRTCQHDDVLMLCHSNFNNSYCFECYKIFANIANDVLINAGKIKFNKLYHHMFVFSCVEGLDIDINNIITMYYMQLCIN